MLHDEQADTSRRNPILRGLMAFGEFWWDFLVGDTPELVPGVLLVLGAAALAVHEHAPRFVVVGVVPVAAIVVLCASVFRHRKSRR